MQSDTGMQLRSLDASWTVLYKGLGSYIIANHSDEQTGDNISEAHEMLM